jgi:hypothetical protein
MGTRREYERYRPQLDAATEEALTRTLDRFAER